jgi:hypothetical protein
MTIMAGPARPGACETTQAKPKAAAPMAAITSINVKWCRDGVILCFRRVDPSARQPHGCAFEGFDCKKSSLFHACRAPIILPRLSVRANYDSPFKADSAGCVRSGASSDESLGKRGDDCGINFGARERAGHHGVHKRMRRGIAVLLHIAGDQCSRQL